MYSYEVMVIFVVRTLHTLEVFPDIIIQYRTAYCVLAYCGYLQYLVI
jgi:hypothetical protein